MNEKVKIIKDGVTKEIYKDELATYIAMGWTEVKYDSSLAFNSFSKVK